MPSSNRDPWEVARAASNTLLAPEQADTRAEEQLVVNEQEVHRLRIRVEKTDESLGSVLQPLERAFTLFNGNGERERFHAGLTERTSFSRSLKLTSSIVATHFPS